MPTLVESRADAMARWLGIGLFLFTFVIERLWLSMTFPTFSDTLQKEAACGGCWR